MSDVGNIKSPGPIRPPPAVEKGQRKEEAKDRPHPRREQPPRREKDEEDGGIDEYA
jgi:hypothetical protein